jgi:hypothetical protein
MGNAKEKTSFNPYTLHTLFQINVWVDKCLDAILWEWNLTLENVG